MGCEFMKKKIRVAVISTAGVLILGTGIWFAVKSTQKSTINVYSLSELKQQIWGESTSLQGSVSSHVSQEVRLLENQIVSKVHVQEGQEIKEGDPLLSYDMTLVDIDLEMEKLNKQQLEIKKKGLEQELNKLKKDRSMLTAGIGSYELDDLGGKTWKVVQVSETQNPPQMPELPEGSETPVDPQNPETPVDPNPSGDSETLIDPETPVDPDPSVDQETPVNPETPVDPEAPTNPETPVNPETPTPSGVYKRLYSDVSIDHTEFPEDDAIIENAVPYAGTGTKEDPYVFLCTEDVLIQGAFLNKIAGFGASGERESTPAYCKLEVRSENRQDGLLQAAMLLDGSALESCVQPEVWFRTRLGKNEWEQVAPEEDDWSEIPDGAGDIFSDDQIISGYSKEELDKAIGEKEREIVTAGLDIKDAELKIKKVEEQLQDETVRSTINGVVKKVGDPAKGEIDGEPFIVVESSGGVYVQGMVGEDMLGKIKPGQMLTGNGFESMMPFEAEVKEVSPYPGNNSYMYSDRELSYYPFTAFIENSEGLKDNEMVTMTMPQEEGEVTGIFVSKEYVRSKNGEDFVYKEGKKGKLEKQTVKTGRTFYGYLIEIKEGVTEEDYLAFPYGKTVKEGAAVKRSTLAEKYSMY